MDLPGANHVKDLHEHEGREDEREVARWSKVLVHVFSVQFSARPVSCASWEDEAGVGRILVLGNCLWDDIFSSKEEHE